MWCINHEGHPENKGHKETWTLSSPSPLIPFCTMWFVTLRYKGPASYEPSTSSVRYVVRGLTPHAKH